MGELPVPLSFNWDKGNVDKNWKKHSVYYKEAEEVFFNQPLKTYRDVGHSQTEERFVALGVTNRGRNLHIVFTIRRRRIRIISAREQSRKERKFYAKE